MGGDIARIRFMLLSEGISFYELEEKPSPTEYFDCETKSVARSIMSEKGISLQDLKKGTIYEALEKKGEKKEDIEKQVKAMAAMEKEEEERSMYYAQSYAFSNSSSSKAATIQEEDKLKDKVFADAEWLSYIRSHFYDDEDVKKDMEMYGDLDDWYFWEDEDDEEGSEED